MSMTFWSGSHCAFNVPSWGIAGNKHHRVYGYTRMGWFMEQTIVFVVGPAMAKTYRPKRRFMLRYRYRTLQARQTERSIKSHSKMTKLPSR